MPKKNYNNRAMITEVAPQLEAYFFPKHNPPVTVRAGSREEAVKIVASLNKSGGFNNKN